MTTPIRLLAAALAAGALGACAGPSKSARSEGTQSPVPQRSNAGVEDQQNPEGPAGAQVPAGGHAAHHGAGHHGPGMAQGACPMALPGTTVSASATDDGAALTFSTSGDVEELRRRVRAAAAHHARMAEAHAGAPAGMGSGATAAAAAGSPGPAQEGDGTTGTSDPAASGTGAGCCGGAGPAGHGKALLSATARAEDVEGGARLLLTPRDPAQADALRAEVREHAARMASGGGCPMTMGG
jgi:hypothetical protein